MGALYKGMIVAGILAAIAFYFITDMMMGHTGQSMNGIFYSALIGLGTDGGDGCHHRVLHGYGLQAR